MAAAPASDDLIQPFQLESLGSRGRLVRLGAVAQSVLGAHDYPDLVAGLLGETLALAAVLSAALKYDGVFTLQTKGDGALSMMVADITSDGDMRGYAEFDPGQLLEAAAPAPPGAGTAEPVSVPRVLGAGYLAFTVDQGPEAKRYQGIVELEGATLAECAHQYFRKSEQIETGIRLAAGRRGNGDGQGAWRAGGMMLQRMPPAAREEEGSGDTPVMWDDEAEENWRRALTLMGSLTDDELLDPGLGPNDLLYRLFHEERVRVYRPRPLVYRCRCSRERVKEVLAAMPRDEVQALEVDGQVIVTCQFCNARYSFDEKAVASLFTA
jgi:molecular chaperone Hsp33